MDDKTVEALKAKHPDVKLVVLTAPGGEEVVVKKPDRIAFRRYRGAMMDDARRADANENLLRQCLVHPDAAAFEAMLDEAPGLSDTFSGKLLRIAGLGNETQVEKKAL
jgi:hypothetical protein